MRRNERFWQPTKHVAAGDFSETPSWHSLALAFQRSSTVRYAGECEEPRSPFLPTTRDANKRRGFLLVPTVPHQAKPTPPFKHELVSLNPQLVRSTCDRCGAFVFGRYSNGSLEKWESKHDCDTRIAKLTPLSRIRFWLSH